MIRLSLFFKEGLEPVGIILVPARKRRAVFDDVADRPGHAALVKGAGDVVVWAKDIEIAALQAFDHEIDGLFRCPGGRGFFAAVTLCKAGEDKARDQKMGRYLRAFGIAQFVLEGFGENLHACFRHIVGRIARRSCNALLGAGVDDEPGLAMCQHIRSEDPRAIDDAEEIDAEDAVPVCLSAEDRGFRTDAGVVHQHMDAAEALNDSLFDRLQRRLVGNVRLDCHHTLLAGNGFEFATSRCQPVAIEIGDDDAHTRLGKALCRRKADAGCATGDHRNIGLFENLLDIRHGTGLLNHYSDAARYGCAFRAVKHQACSARKILALASRDNLAKSARDTGLCRPYATDLIIMASNKDVKKVVLAYSGGLDTSIILKWLQTELGAEVVTFTADLGQGEELEPARKKAEMLGIKEIYVEDVREEFVKDFVFPMFRANAVYEGVYLLGTSIARPLISKHLIDIARKTGADAIAHGATGKGNDQVRFELSAYALNPDIKIIAPWRDWAFKSRTELLAFAEQHQIPVAKDKKGEAPFSVDANLLHSSSEGKVLEDPAQEAPEYVHMRTISPETAPDKATVIKVGFEKGDAVSINGVSMSPATLLATLNSYGRDNGIGRLDLVENRFVGMKSRGVYETPGGTILLSAHRAIESITLDRGAAHLKDEMMPRYAELIYYGFWFSPEREMLQALIDKSQEHVEGEVTLKLYKGNVMVIGRESPKSLYSDKLVTFEDDQGAYDQKDAAGFIKLNALRLRTLAKRNLKR